MWQSVLLGAPSVAKHQVGDAPEQSLIAHLHPHAPSPFTAALSCESGQGGGDSITAFQKQSSGEAFGPHAPKESKQHISSRIHD